MRYPKFAIAFLAALSLIGLSASAQESVRPKVLFTGDEFADKVSVIYAETLQDMLNKLEDGSNPKFPAGFFHTSTEEAGVPQYYNDMWSRDVGRGLTELSRLGFSKESLTVSRYLLSHITMKNHWGREVHHVTDKCELDGNVLLLTGICSAWNANGMDLKIGEEFCNGIAPVVEWIDSMINVSPYYGLLPSTSELSGNPSTDYAVYSIFGNYGIYCVSSQIEEMAEASGRKELAELAASIHERMSKALESLISDGVKSYAPKGCWFNGIDGRSGRAYDISEWDGTSWPVWHWTRQLPYILEYDSDVSGIPEKFGDVNRSSYALLLEWMSKGEYFRKYGFVSNTGWTGMGGRHDETMAGYGQGFFTQAALMADDVNAYTKCLEGIARLGYDGGVVQQMSYEKNPFVIHECFNYDNYEHGLDHTFGVHSEGRREIMENPGDEGNLVQEAENLKAVNIAVGLKNEGGRLVFKPRLPWMWSGMQCVDWPVVDNKGVVRRLSVNLKHERWLRKCTIEIEGADGFDGIDVRFGPFPRQLKNPKNFEIEQTGDVSWIWIRNIKSGRKKITLTVEL
jgi:hypothetical protein